MMYEPDEQLLYSVYHERLKVSLQYFKDFSIVHLAIGLLSPC